MFYALHDAPAPVSDVVGRISSRHDHIIRPTSPRKIFHSLKVRPEPSPARSPYFTDFACRSCDVLLALMLIAFVAPLLLAIYLLVRAESSHSAIFRHPRIGRGGRPFDCYKFRTMLPNADSRLQELLRTDPAAREEWDRCQKLHDDPRVTRLGSFLRRSSLDELPQLINVLRGDMSLVGPRPIIAGEVVRYGHRISGYLAVRPGITGLWQVSGRNETTYRRRVALDALYAQKRSTALYFVLLARTVPTILLQRGAC